MCDWWQRCLSIQVPRKFRKHPAQSWLRSEVGSQPLHELSDDGDLAFIFCCQDNWLVVSVQRMEGDLEVAPGGVGGGGGGGAFVAFDCVAGVGFGVGGLLELDEEDAAVAGAGDGGGEDAPGVVGDAWFHGFAGDFGDEHAAVEFAADVDGDPVVPVGVVGDELWVAEGTGGSFQGDEGEAVDVALFGAWLDESEFGGPGLCLVGGAGCGGGVVPACVCAESFAEFGFVQVAGEFAEVADHGCFIGEVADGDFDDFVAVVAEPVADLAVVFGAGGVTVEVLAESVEVDADAFVGSMVDGAVDDVGCGGADGLSESELFAADAVFKSGRLQQVLEVSFGIVGGL